MVRVKLSINRRKVARSRPGVPVLFAWPQRVGVELEVSSIDAAVVEASISVALQVGEAVVGNGARAELNC